MSRLSPPTHKTRNWPSYNEALKRPGSLTIWSDPATTWAAAPTGTRGRQGCDGDAAGEIARNEILRTLKRVSRTIWRRWSGCHRRSRAETKMHSVKPLRQRLSARDFDRQVAEVQVRVDVLNGFTALGTPTTEVAEQVCPGKGEVRS